MSRGIVFVVSAPSGAGKSTLIRGLMESMEGLAFSVSHTTRPPRPGEADGDHYHFVDRAAFERLRDEGGFLEWAEVHGNLYGTSVKAVEEARSEGCDVILDIDVQGAESVRGRLSDCVFVFVLPPSVAELERRLRNRGEGEATMRRRLDNALAELKKAGGYDYVIVNDDFGAALGQFAAVVTAERLRPARCRALSESGFLG